MQSRHQVTIDGQSFKARPGELLLDAALRNGIDLKYDCRAGHCGTCCVRLVSGSVRGGDGAEPGVVHACQCRIAGDVEVQSDQQLPVRTVGGVVSTLRHVAPDVVEVCIATDRAFPYLPGQYADVRFKGFPGRPFSITHPLQSPPKGRAVSFHIRKMENGRVTNALGTAILPGHHVTLSGPYGSAYFKSGQMSRLILVSTSTGFAPIWSIAVAALRENPERRIMVIAGGRTIQNLYMAPALAQLARFPNVLVVPICSTPQAASAAVRLGRPTDVLPRFIAGDVIYVCGAPAMVDAVKTIARSNGVVCHADPFVPVAADKPEEGVFARAMDWLSLPASQPPRTRPSIDPRPTRGPAASDRGLQI